jgi:hypothetical protein
LIIRRGRFEIFLLKNNAKAFVELVDFRKCQKYSLKVFENSYNMSNINLFQNMHKSKMNSKCNLWETNL